MPARAWQILKHSILWNNSMLKGMLSRGQSGELLGGGVRAIWLLDFIKA